MQLFRRLLLLRLQQTERLSESFMGNLLSWVHSGFSVYAGPPVEAAEIASPESQTRYISRPVLALDALEKLDDGSLVLETPPDPRTGATSVPLDPLEWFTASRPISPTRDAIAKDFKEPIPTAGGFPWRLQMTKPPACRQRNLPSGTIRMAPGKPAARGLAWSGKSSRWIRCCVLAAAACALSPLLRIPALSTASCGIAKSSTRKPRILSNQERLPLRSQTLSNNSGDAVDVRLLNQTPVEPGCA
jgi:hypothetical protein